MSRLTSAADLKNTSDDALPNYLNSLNFAQSHRLTDVRLALGYGALSVAVACFVWDWKLGFDGTKYYSAVAVVLYVLLNAALTLWSRNVVRGTVYVGTSASGETVRSLLCLSVAAGPPRGLPAHRLRAQVSIATSVEKYTPVYHVDITVTARGAPKPQTISIARPFSEWFDSAGTFVAAPFQTMLATAVPAIGKADPKRVAAAAAAPSSSQTAYSPAVLDMLAAASAADASAVGSESDSGVATGTAGKKGGKRRKATTKA